MPLEAQCGRCRPGGNEEKARKGMASNAKRSHESAGNGSPACGAGGFFFFWGRGGFWGGGLPC